MFVGLMLILSCFVFPAHVARASHTQGSTDKTEITPTQDVADATVNLYCRTKTGRKIISTSGSGVFVSDRGVILTNAHVAQYFLLGDTEKKVSTQCSVRAGSPARERYRASVLYFPPLWVEKNADELAKKQPKGTGEEDFALLYITGAKKGTLPDHFPVLAVDTTGTAGEDAAVTITGYPTEKLGFDGVQRKLAMTSASSTITGTNGFGRSGSADVLTLAPSAAGSHGISGGPVLDTDGEVIGIAVAKGAAENDRTLRAITLSYIERIVRTRSAFPLDILLAGDFAAEARISDRALPPDTRTIIANALLKQKK
jgi:S1-C subfamily serine protease